MQGAEVVAKVCVDERKEIRWQPQAREITLRCVHASELTEDQRFSEATPSGHITLFVNNPKAVEKLDLGKTFYVYFVPVEP